MEKAVHEAKQHTDWNESQSDITKRLCRILSPTLCVIQSFTPDLENFVACYRQSRAYINSLAQTLIKLTAPGVPDIYQGSELWDFSLVDPDNRRPVDFELRQRFAGERQSCCRRRSLETPRRRPAQTLADSKNAELARTACQIFRDLIMNRLFAQRRECGTCRRLFARRPGHDRCSALLAGLNNDWQDTHACNCRPGTGAMNSPVKSCTGRIAIECTF